MGEIKEFYGFDGIAEEESFIDSNKSYNRLITISFLLTFQISLTPDPSFPVITPSCPFYPL